MTGKAEAAVCFTIILGNALAVKTLKPITRFMTSRMIINSEWFFIFTLWQILLEFVFFFCPRPATRWSKASTLRRCGTAQTLHRNKNILFTLIDILKAPVAVPWKQRQKRHDSLFVCQKKRFLSFDSVNLQMTLLQVTLRHRIIPGVKRLMYWLVFIIIS